MFEYVGPALRVVTAEAALVLGNQGSSAAKISGAFMRWMAICATHSAFRHGMMTREVELAADLGMTLEAHGFF